MSSANNYSYEWPVSSTTPWSTPQYGPNVNGLTAGSYTVLATGSNGCTGNIVGVMVILLKILIL